MDIIITIPKKIKWVEYQKELDIVHDGSNTMKFKVPFFPKSTNIGDRCYVVHNGCIRGWMEITNFMEDSFTCTTTGRKWHGKFIERSGQFHKIRPIAYKGFQGWRYYENI